MLIESLAIVNGYSRHIIDVQYIAETRENPGALVLLQYLRKLLGEKKYDEQEKIKADQEEIDLTSLTGEVSKSGTRVD